MSKSPVAPAVRDAGPASGHPQSPPPSGSPTPTPTPPRAARSLPQVPRRPVGLPPAPLADLTMAERQEKVRQLGLPAFRAKQLSTHYFGRLERDPAGMTDIPATARTALAERMLPPLLTPVREAACDDGATRKALWRLHDGSLVESVLMGYPACLDTHTVARSG